jgi:hypothetical protein
MTGRETRKDAKRRKALYAIDAMVVKALKPKERKAEVSKGVER